MSYRIEYQWACLLIDRSISEGCHEPLYVIAIEGGCNNLTTINHLGQERRVRSWEIGMVGTERQVLRQATRAAGSCEGGMLKAGGRYCTPEAYIRRIRRLMKVPLDPARTLSHLGLGVLLPARHSLCSPASEHPAMNYYREGDIDSGTVKLSPKSVSHWPLYFELLEPGLDDFSIQPWNTGTIFGLPKS